MFVRRTSEKRNNRTEGIADLVLQVQSQQTKVTSVNIANSNADDLVIEYNHKRHMSNCIGRC